MKKVLLIIIQYFFIVSAYSEIKYETSSNYEFDKFSSVAQYGGLSIRQTSSVSYQYSFDRVNWSTYQCNPGCDVSGVKTSRGILVNGKGYTSNGTDFDASVLSLNWEGKSAGDEGVVFFDEATDNIMAVSRESANNGNLRDWVYRLHLSDDAGETWQPIFESQVNEKILDGAIFNSSIYFVTASQTDGFTLYSSINGGAWQSQALVTYLSEIDNFTSNYDYSLTEARLFQTSDELALYLSGKTSSNRSVSGIMLRIGDMWKKVGHGVDSRIIASDQSYFYIASVGLIPVTLTRTARFDEFEIVKTQIPELEAHQANIYLKYNQGPFNVAQNYTTQLSVSDSIMMWGNSEYLFIAEPPYQAEPRDNSKLWIDEIERITLTDGTEAWIKLDREAVTGAPYTKVYFRVQVSVDLINWTTLEDYTTYGQDSNGLNLLSNGTSVVAFREVYNEQAQDCAITSMVYAGGLSLSENSISDIDGCISSTYMSQPSYVGTKSYSDVLGFVQNGIYYIISFSPEAVFAYSSIDGINWTMLGSSDLSNSPNKINEISAFINGSAGFIGNSTDGWSNENKVTNDLVNFTPVTRTVDVNTLGSIVQINENTLTLRADVLGYFWNIQNLEQGLNNIFAINVSFTFDETITQQLSDYDIQNDQQQVIILIQDVLNSNQINQISYNGYLSESYSGFSPVGLAGLELTPVIINEPVNNVSELASYISVNNNSYQLKGKESGVTFSFDQKNYWTRDGITWATISVDSGECHPLEGIRGEVVIGDSFSMSLITDKELYKKYCFNNDFPNEDLSLQIAMLPAQNTYSISDIITVVANGSGGAGDLEYRLIIKERVRGSQNILVYRSSWQIEDNFTLVPFDFNLESGKEYNIILKVRDEVGDRVRTRQRIKIQ